MHEHNVNSYYIATMFINKSRRPSSSWKSNRRSGSRSKRREAEECNSNVGIPTSLANEPSEELWTNLKSSKDTSSSCTSSKEGGNNALTLKKPGNAPSIFYATPSSPCAAAFNRNSKSYNQLLPPPPPSAPSSSTSWFLFLLVFSWNLSSTSSFCPPYCSCDDIALSVDCHSASNLRVVPIFLNPQIKFLSLSKNQIKDITMSLQFYSELQVLDISHNKLESLGKTNFESLKSLHLLNVSYNSIKALESGVFIGLAHIRVVDLSGNQLDRVEREIFWSLSSIKEIILDRNRLEFLDWDLFRGLDTLERISAKFNFIQVIEPSTSFSLSSGGSSVGAVVGSLTSKNYSNYKNGSESVNMTAARRSKGEVSSWTLKSVRYLDISSNQLTRVKDYGLVIFGALKELNLCCNYIHTLEEKAFLISSTATSSSGHLERLNLSQNRLGRVPTESLEKLGSTLRQLDLSSNRISDHISKNAFRGLVNLESLQLSDNPEILNIDPDALSENINLINFEADYLSNVTEISPNLLKNKVFLENFSLKYASISSLSPEFFQPPISNVVGCLDLAGNPIDCNCSAHSFFQFVTEDLGASAPSSPHSANSPYNFDQSIVSGLRDENNNLIRENAFRSNPNDDGVEGKSNSSSQPNTKLPSHSNPNLISHQSTSSSTRSRSFPKNNNLSNNNNNMNTRPNLLYVRCQSPSNLGGVLVKDLKHSDFEHCFTADDQFQIMVICIAAGILSLIFLTLAIKLCCVCGVFRRLSSFCKTHCSTANCCHLKSRNKEKQTSDKLFFDSMTIALRRDLAPVAPPPNFNANLPNGKSILGEHAASQLLYCGNGTSIPLTTSGCVIGGGSGGGSSGTLGRNGNGNHPIAMSMDYEDSYQDEDDDDGDDEEPHHHRSQHFGHREQLERCYAPIEPPPPIPIPLQFPNQVQSLSRKQQQKHQQLLLHHGHQHHSPTMGYSPKHYSHHRQHSPKHSKHQQQHNPPVIVHYEYPDFPSMNRVKQVPSVLV
ncbi:unnamed protein product [Orchesella dallaii]|uniref:Uncharacterized protein n=1 Tax=Orchesella dallaii TaxID=48710 RepID=A0ABP1RFV3_9HEXA